jgi:hypothetical protein
LYVRPNFFNYFFKNSDIGGLAMFILLPRADGSFELDGKVQFGPDGGFFDLDTCGLNCEVLVKFDKAPKARIITSVERES